MTPRQAIFVAIVRDGLRRARRAVEHVRRRRPAEVLMGLDWSDPALDAADPARPPTLRFCCPIRAPDRTMVGGYAEVEADATSGAMVAAIDRAIDGLEARAAARAAAAGSDGRVVLGDPPPPPADPGPAAIADRARRQLDRDRADLLLQLGPIEAEVADRLRAGGGP